MSTLPDAPHPREIEVQVGHDERTSALIYPAQRVAGRRPATLILAHGAGTGLRHPFMIGFARALRDRGLDIVTFNFLYIQRGRHIPDRMPQLVSCYRAVIAAARENLDSARKRLFIGGKSMGGRAATHVAAEDPALPLSGIVLLGYPLHPIGRPDQLRDAHLPGVKRPMLFVQGTRDTFGSPDELKPILARLSPSPTLRVVDGGEHSFKIRAKDAKKQAGVYEEVQDDIVAWIDRTG